jgi:hypothetical protein
VVGEISIVWLPRNVTTTNSYTSTDATSVGDCAARDTEGVWAGNHGRVGTTMLAPTSSAVLIFARPLAELFRPLVY